MNFICYSVIAKHFINWFSASLANTFPFLLLPIENFVPRCWIACPIRKYSPNLDSRLNLAIFLRRRPRFGNSKQSSFRSIDSRRNLNGNKSPELFKNLNSTLILRTAFFGRRWHSCAGQNFISPRFLNRPSLKIFLNWRRKLTSKNESIIHCYKLKIAFNFANFRFQCLKSRKAGGRFELRGCPISQIFRLRFPNLELLNLHLRWSSWVNRSINFGIVVLWFGVKRFIYGETCSLALIRNDNMWVIRIMASEEEELWMKHQNRPQTQESWRLFSRPDFSTFTLWTVNY